MKDDKLVFRMFSDGVAPTEVGDLAPGSLIPHQRFWTFRATDMNGNIWTCDLVHPQNHCSYLCSPPAFVVSGELWQIEGRRKELPFREFGLTVDVPGEFSLPFERGTETLSVNRTTGDEVWKSNRDSTAIVTSACRILAHRGDDYVRFRILGDHVAENVETRICESFQFVMARPTWWEVLYYANSEDQYVRIRPRERMPKPSRLPMPLQEHWQPDIWQMFVSYFEFVAKEANGSNWHPISAFLEEVCEASTGSFALQSLVLAVAIEGILELAVGNVVEPSSEFLEAVDRLISHVKGWDEFADPHGLPMIASIKHRALGTLANLKRIRAKERLLALKGAGVVTGELIKNWESLRNAVAHGKSSTGLPKDADVEAIVAAQALLYRIILHVIGYTGHFTDYATRGWPTSPFPTGMDAQAGPP